MSVRSVAPLVVTVVLLAVANLGAHRWFPQAGLAVNAVLFVALIGVAWWAGLSADQLGVGRSHLGTGVRWSLWILAGAVVLFAVALALPWLRNLVSGTPSGNAPLRMLVTIPLGTVLVEEFAFRGVLWGLLDRDFGSTVATVGSAALFGLWHVLAALDGGEANASLTTLTGAGGGATAVRVVVTVVFTFCAGLLFGALRSRSGSLLPSATLHWASNAFGVLYVALVG